MKNRYPHASYPHSHHQFALSNHSNQYQPGYITGKDKQQKAKGSNQSHGLESGSSRNSNVVVQGIENGQIVMVRINNDLVPHIAVSQPGSPFPQLVQVAIDMNSYVQRGSEMGGRRVVISESVLDETSSNLSHQEIHHSKKYLPTSQIDNFQRYPAHCFQTEETRQDIVQTEMGRVSKEDWRDEQEMERKRESKRLKMTDSHPLQKDCHTSFQDFPHQSTMITSKQPDSLPIKGQSYSSQIRQLLKLTSAQSHQKSFTNLSHPNHEENVSLDPKWRNAISQVRTIQVHEYQQPYDFKSRQVGMNEDWRVSGSVNHQVQSHLTVSQRSSRFRGLSSSISSQNLVQEGKTNKSVGKRSQNRQVVKSGSSNRQKDMSSDRFENGSNMVILDQISLMSKNKRKSQVENNNDDIDEFVNDDSDELAHEIPSKLVPYSTTCRKCQCNIGYSESEGQGYPESMINFADSHIFKKSTVNCDNESISRLRNRSNKENTVDGSSREGCKYMKQKNLMNTILTSTSNNSHLQNPKICQIRDSTSATREGTFQIEEFPLREDQFYKQQHSNAQVINNLSRNQDQNFLIIEQGIQKNQKDYQMNQNQRYQGQSQTGQNRNARNQISEKFMSFNENQTNAQVQLNLQMLRKLNSNQITIDPDLLQRSDLCSQYFPNLDCSSKGIDSRLLSISNIEPRHHSMNQTQNQMIQNGPNFSYNNLPPKESKGTQIEDSLVGYEDFENKGINTMDGSWVNESQTVPGTQQVNYSKLSMHKASPANISLSTTPMEPFLSFKTKRSKSKNSKKSSKIRDKTASQQKERKLSKSKAGLNKSNALYRLGVDKIKKNLLKDQPRVEGKKSKRSKSLGNKVMKSMGGRKKKKLQMTSEDCLSTPIYRQSGFDYPLNIICPTDLPQGVQTHVVSYNQTNPISMQRDDSSMQNQIEKLQQLHAYYQECVQKILNSNPQSFDNTQNQEVCEFQLMSPTVDDSQKDEPVSGDKSTDYATAFVPNDQEQAISYEEIAYDQSHPHQFSFPSQIQESSQPDQIIEEDDPSIFENPRILERQETELTAPYEGSQPLCEDNFISHLQNKGSLSSMGHIQQNHPSNSILQPCSRITSCLSRPFSNESDTPGFMSITRFPQNSSSRPGQSEAITNQHSNMQTNRGKRVEIEGQQYLHTFNQNDTEIDCEGQQQIDQSQQWNQLSPQIRYGNCTQQFPLFQNIPFPDQVQQVPLKRRKSQRVSSKSRSKKLRRKRNKSCTPHQRKQDGMLEREESKYFNSIDRIVKSQKTCYKPTYRGKTYILDNDVVRLTQTPQHKFASIPSQFQSNLLPEKRVLVTPQLRRSRRTRAKKAKSPPTVHERLYRRSLQFTPHLTRDISTKLKTLSKLINNSNVLKQKFDKKCAKQSKSIPVKKHKTFSETTSLIRNRQIQSKDMRQNWKLEAQKARFNTKLKEIDSHWKDQVRFYIRSVDAQRRRADSYKQTIQEMTNRITLINQQKGQILSLAMSGNKSCKSSSGTRRGARRLGQSDGLSLSKRNSNPNGYIPLRTSILTRNSDMAPQFAYGNMNSDKSNQTSQERQYKYVQMSPDYPRFDEPSVSQKSAKSSKKFLNQSSQKSRQSRKSSFSKQSQRGDRQIQTAGSLMNLIRQSSKDQRRNNKDLDTLLNKAQTAETNPIGDSSFERDIRLSHPLNDLVQKQAYSRSINTHPDNLVICEGQTLNDEPITVFDPSRTSDPQISLINHANYPGYLNQVKEMRRKKHQREYSFSLANSQSEGERVQQEKDNRNITLTYTSTVGSQNSTAQATKRENFESLTDKIRKNNLEIKRIEKILFGEGKAVRARKQEQPLSRQISLRRVEEMVKTVMEKKTCINTNSTEKSISFTPYQSSASLLQQASKISSKESLKLSIYPRVDEVSLDKIKKLREFDKLSQKTRLY